MTMAITIDRPGYPASGQRFRMSGKLSGYSSAPKLLYADDPIAPGAVKVTAASETRSSISLQWSAPATGTTYKAFPSGSSVSRSAFSFMHPAFAHPGHHTVVVTDGHAWSQVGFGISNAASARLNPFR